MVLVSDVHHEPSISERVAFLYLFLKAVMDYIAKPVLS